jgi:hypothetical protein
MGALGGLFRSHTVIVPVVARSAESVRGLSHRRPASRIFISISLPGADKEDVVVLIALEWRVEIDEVYGLVLDVPAEYVKVVAVIEDIARHFKPRS